MQAPAGLTAARASLRKQSRGRGLTDRGRSRLLATLAAMALAGAGLVAGTLMKEPGLPAALALHAGLMIAAWGVLLPMGGIVARYYKVTARQRFPEERDNLFWWRWHQRLQYGGTALAALALILVVSETGGRFATWHGRAGLIVMALAALQVLSTLVRGDKGGPTDNGAEPDRPDTWRGDHYDMTRRRRLFEAWHKRAGWAVLVLAGVTMLLGAVLVGAPAWLLAALGCLQAAALAAGLDGAARRRWVDTYVAIWGPDPIHPGNRLPGPPSKKA